MANIDEFLKIETDYIRDFNINSVSGSSFGDHGDGYGTGDGSGSCPGFGYSDGSGVGRGDGWGANWGDGLKSLDNNDIHYIDGIPTIIKSIKNNIAKGFIVDTEDFTQKPCYVARVGNCFAHADNIRQAVEEAQNKYFESLDAETKIAEFVKTFNNDDKYPAQDFFKWHNILTGSCLMGRNEFVKIHGYDLDNDIFTVKEFILICENDFGGDIIKRLKEFYK